MVAAADNSENVDNLTAVAAVDNLVAPALGNFAGSVLDNFVEFVQEYFVESVLYNFAGFVPDDFVESVLDNFVVLLGVGVAADN